MSEFGDSFHQLTTSIITQLVAFVQLKYHATDPAQNPLTTHPTTMLVALSSLFIYYVLHVVLLRSPGQGRFAAHAERFLAWSGYAAVASLTAAVFPEEAAPFLYTIFGLLSAFEVLYQYMHGEIREDDGSMFEICKICVCFCFQHLGKLPKFFQRETPPIPTWIFQN